MITWFNALSQIQQIFACFAIPSTLILLLQTLLLLFGLTGHDGDHDSQDFGYESSSGDHDFDADHDFDYDSDGDGIPDSHAPDSGLRLFTIRGLVAFFSIMGWTGIVLLDAELNTAVSITIAILAGLAAMIITAIVIKWAIKLQSDGTMDISNALGTSGTVYITIPAKRKEKGKINLMLQGQYGEFEAVTDEEQPLTYGTEVTVIGISGANTMVVKRK